ncbi:MAG: hypothetical protein Kow0042_24820 [Calditrichia bacterium]
MEKALRIKPANWLVEIGLPIVLLAAIAGVIGWAAGEITFHFVLATILLATAMLHLFFLLRLKNPAHLIPLGFYLFAAGTFDAIPFQNKYATGALAVLAGIFFALFMCVLFKRKIKWRYRDVLELAARSVRSAEDGFTARPFPAGKIEAKPDELKSFAKFLLQQAIAYPVADGQKLVLVIPENLIVYLTGLKKDYRAATYVEINAEGQMAVKISEKDYRRYQQEFTFDQLCAALGNLFADFLEMHRSGKDAEIISQMNELRLVI